MTSGPSNARRDRMRFGVYLPQVGRAANPVAIRDVVQAAEEMGYASAWVGDHLAPTRGHAPDYPFNEAGAMPIGADQPILEAFTTLSYVAGLTEAVRLGTSVAVIPYRHPLLLAKIVATLDVLSEGRAVLGAGLGWMREEFEALGLDFAGRGVATDEALELLRLAWSSEEPVDFEGDRVRVRDVYANPSPPQGPELPVWIGGSGKRALERVARCGDAWYPHLFGSSPDALRDGAERLSELRPSDASPAQVALFAPLDLRESEQAEAREAGAPRPWESGVLQGGPDTVAADLEHLASAPVTHVVLALGGSPQRRIRTLERFSSEIVPRLS